MCAMGGTRPRWTPSTRGWHVVLQIYICLMCCGPGCGRAAMIRWVFSLTNYIHVSICVCVTVSRMRRNGCTGGRVRYLQHWPRRTPSARGGRVVFILLSFDIVHVLRSRMLQSKHDAMACLCGQSYRFSSVCVNVSRMRRNACGGGRARYGRHSPRRTPSTRGWHNCRPAGDSGWACRAAGPLSASTWRSPPTP